MVLAQVYSSYSKNQEYNTGRGVGAVIVDKYNRLVSTGFNGLPKGISDTKDRYADTNVKHYIMVHAELNAILFAEKRRLKGSTIYVYPYMPCSQCAAAMIQVGISKLVYYDMPPKESSWYANCVIAKNILLETGIQIEQYVEEEV
jgi:dCMP deaminase